jgi:uncharacterized membrane protein
MGLIGVIAGLIAAAVGALAGIIGGLLGAVMGLLGGLLGLLPVLFPVVLIALGIVWLLKTSNANHGAVESMDSRNVAPPVSRRSR